MAGTQTESPGADRIVAEKWALYRESFRMARILLKEQEPETWEDRLAQDHFWSALPMLALSLQEQMLSGSHFVAQAPEKDQIERYDHALSVVRSMQAANDAAEKKAKES